MTDEWVFCLRYSNSEWNQWLSISAMWRWQHSSGVVEALHISQQHTYTDTRTSNAFNWETTIVACVAWRLNAWRRWHRRSCQNCFEKKNKKNERKVNWFERSVCGASARRPKRRGKKKNARTSKHLQNGGNGVYRYTNCKYTKFDENRNVFKWYGLPRIVGE